MIRMTPLSSLVQDWKRKTPLAQVRAEAICARQRAIAMKEEAAESRLHLWLERLRELPAHTGRDMALERALDAALSVASADCANIQRVHPSGRGLVLEAQRGFWPPFLDFFAFVDDGNTACGVALEQRRPVVVEDIIRSPIFVGTRGLEVLLEAGIRAVKSAPLIGRQGQMLGMISVHYRKPRAHVDSELTRLQALAASVAALIDDR
jgi:GAF domain-containing protein